MGSVWNMGGPWVTPDKACRWFLQSETSVKGPQKYSSKLPLPGVKDGYDSRPQHGVKHSMGLAFEHVDYRDTAVVAFRTLKGKRPAAHERMCRLIRSKQSCHPDCSAPFVS